MPRKQNNNQKTKSTYPPAEPAREKTKPAKPPASKKPARKNTPARETKLLPPAALDDTTNGDSDNNTSEHIYDTESERLFATDSDDSASEGESRARDGKSAAPKEMSKHDIARVAAAVTSDLSNIVASELAKALKQQELTRERARPSSTMSGGSDSDPDQSSGRMPPKKMPKHASMPPEKMPKQASGYDSDDSTGSCVLSSAGANASMSRVDPQEPLRSKLRLTSEQKNFAAYKRAMYHQGLKEDAVSTQERLSELNMARALLTSNYNSLRQIASKCPDARTQRAIRSILQGMKITLRSMKTDGEKLTGKRYVPGAADIYPDQPARDFIGHVESTRLAIGAKKTYEEAVRLAHKSLKILKDLTPPATSSAERGHGGGGSYGGSYGGRDGSYGGRDGGYNGRGGGYGGRDGSSGKSGIGKNSKGGALALLGN